MIVTSYLQRMHEIGFYLIDIILHDGLFMENEYIYNYVPSYVHEKKYTFTLSLDKKMLFYV